MKISVTDKHGSGVALQFAKAIGATVKGRFFYIPKSKGGGYITGFSWANEMRLGIRNFYLNEDILLERTNEIAEGQENILFILSGIFPSPLPTENHVSEPGSVLVTMQTVSSVLNMSSNTFFRSIVLAVTRQHLQKLFGNIKHPVIVSILEGKENFAFECSVSNEMVKTASEMLQQPVPESLESYYYKLKSEELLCYVFAQLMQREAMASTNMHINDIKAIYALKLRLQSKLNEPPDIASLAKEAGMSEPKMRKLFKQTFGKGVFEYYQSARMEKAALLLKEKKLSVSEAGYQLGFTNLSHFSRVFEQHIGIKPKKYSAL